MRDRLLIAEDDEATRNSLARRIGRKLGDRDAILKAATSGEALSILEDSGNRIASVLTDLRLPQKGDGEVIVSKALEKGCKVIVLSGSIDDLSENMKQRCLAVLEKPYRDIDKIVSLIRSTLQID